MTLTTLKASRVKRVALFGIPIFSLFLTLLLLNANIVVASTSISPTTAMTGVPTDFKVRGLTADTQYTVYVDGTLEANTTTDSDGVLSFTLTFDTAGTYQIVIKDITGTSTVATLTVTVYDIISMIMPYFIILIMLGVLVGVLGSFTDIFK